MAKRISEKFGKVPNSKKTISEKFRKKTILSEATPEHILTIRRAHETLVNLGYNYTERSVNNWCYPTPNREPLLDCALDVSGHIRITKRSLEKRIIDIKQNDQIKQDEIAFSENQKSASEKFKNDSEGFGNENGNFGKHQNFSEMNEQSILNEIQKLKEVNLDLKINNKAKEIVIKDYKEERRQLIQERTQLGRVIGGLENKLLMLQPPTVKKENDQDAPDIFEGNKE